jgi:hypothetical protein
MEKPPPVDKSLTDEVLRRVGRNLLLFQQIELLLKDLLSKTGIAGHISEIPRKIAQRAEDVGGKTMGQLAKQYVEEILGESSATASTPEEIHEVYVSYEFKIEADQATRDLDKAVLDALVEERNHLAHTLLKQWNPASAASTEEALAYLEAQRERAIPVRDRLKSMNETLHQGLKEHGDYMMSEEGGRQFELAWLQQSHLVQLLAQIAQAAARPDGWTVLARAGQLARELAADDMKQLGTRFGQSSLKRLLLAAEIFEVYEEPTESAHTRTLYRMKLLPDSGSVDAVH